MTELKPHRTDLHGSNPFAPISSVVYGRSMSVGAALRAVKTLTPEIVVHVAQANDGSMSNRDAICHLEEARWHNRELGNQLDMALKALRLRRRLEAG